MGGWLAQRSMSEVKRDEFHPESLIWDWVTGEKVEREDTVNTSHGYRAWLCNMHGYDRSNSLTCFFQLLKNKDKDTMRESGRKQGTDSNRHMEMQRKRYMRGRLGEKVMRDRRCKGRSYLAVIIQGLIVSWGLVTPVTSTDVHRHSWGNHIVKCG